MHKRLASWSAVALVVALLAVGCGGGGGNTPAATQTGPSPTEAATTAARPNSTSPAAVAAGTSHASLVSGGLTRTYRLFVPPQAKDAKPKSLALVVGLHGGLGTADQFAETSQFETFGARDGFVVVFPDGIDRTWNGGRCCGGSVTKKVDDVGFLAQLIETLSSQLPIDPSRVFMTGHSNGAIMAFRFACERAGLVAGVAPVAGSIEIPDCKPSRGVALLTIHGDADQNHPIGGGKGTRSVAEVPFNSMDDTLRAWTQGMGCSDAPARTTAGPLTTTTWKNCRDGVSVQYVIIAGADHPWPGSADRRASALQGVPTQLLDATATVWAFFKGLPAR